MSRFEETITSRERLREIIKEPGPRTKNKTIDCIDDICARFIAASPFILMATRGDENRMDVSPKGDPAGFVAVLDEKTLAIPDRLGNNRVDSMENLLVYPDIGLIFLIPGIGDTLRISGTAKIVRDRKLQESFAIQGKTPNLVYVVHVEEAFLHCSKSIVRAKLWDREGWPDTSKVPTLAQSMAAHGKLDETVPDLQKIIENDKKTRLY